MKTLMKIVVILVFVVSNANYGLSNAEKSSPSLEQELRWLRAETFVIAASKYVQKISEAPAPVTVITDDEINRYGYRTLSEVLRGVTGFYVTNDRTSECLGVRGYYIPGDWNSRILIMINGLTINDNAYGSTSIDRVLGLDIDSIKRIEIIKGPGSALYGTYALFCVINIITKDGGDLDGITASGQYGSYQSKEGNLSYGKKLVNGLEVLVSGSGMDTRGQDLYFPEFDAPETNNGIFEDGDREEAYSFLTNLSGSDFTCQARLYSRAKGIPTGSYETVFNDNRSKDVDKGGSAELKYTPRLDETKDLLARIYYQYYGFDGDYILDHDGDKENCADWVRNDWIGSEVQLNWKTSGKNRFVIGGEYQNNYRIHQKTYDKGLRGPDYYHEYLNDKRKLEIWCLYLQDIYKMRENLSFILGTRYDYYSTFGKTINPRVGVVYNPLPESTIKLLYGSAFRAPSFFEMYYHDGYYSMKPNPELTPEELETYEVVFEQQMGENIEGCLSLYRTDLSDIISQVKSEELSQNTGEPLLQYVNDDEAKSNGIELSLNGRWQGIEGRFGYNLQKSKDRDTGEELVNSPRNSGNLGVSIPLLQKKIYITTEVQYIGKRLTLREEEEWLNPYLRTNLILFGSNIFSNMDITVKINNLFNESYADPCSTEHRQTKIPQDKRNFLLKTGYRF